MDPSLVSLLELVAMFTVLAVLLWVVTNVRTPVTQPEGTWETNTRRVLTLILCALMVLCTVALYRLGTCGHGPSSAFRFAVLCGG